MIRKQNSVEKVGNYITLLLLLLYIINGIVSIKQQIEALNRSTTENAQRR